MGKEGYFNFLFHLTDPRQTSLRVEPTRRPGYVCYKCLEPGYGEGRLVFSQDNCRVYFHTSCFQDSSRERVPRNSSFEAVTA